MTSPCIKVTNVNEELCRTGSAYYENILVGKYEGERSFSGG
jgi:hypothetical protein